MRCKQWDKAYVECGAMGADSPNVGLVVVCESINEFSPHSVHGPIWNVSTSGPRQIVSEYGAIGLKGQMADEWLRPIPPDEMPPESEPEAVNDPSYREEREKVDA